MCKELTYQGDCICWFGLELMCQFFVVGYQVGNVNVAVVLFDEDIFSNLISIGNPLEYDVWADSIGITCR